MEYVTKKGQPGTPPASTLCRCAYSISAGFQQFPPTSFACSDHNLKSYVFYFIANYQRSSQLTATCAHDQPLQQRVRPSFFWYAKKAIQRPGYTQA